MECNKILEAKRKEINNWKNQKVFIEVDDIGPKCVSTRWVLTKKMLDGNPITKAQLSARGFEKIQDFRTDCPCYSQIGIHLALTFIVPNKWTLQSANVKTPLLQGKAIERTIFLCPPSEADTNKIWKFQKCVYGLADVSRYWYLSVKNELLKLNASTSKSDPRFFYWKENNKLIGFIICPVDDIIWAGSELFKCNIISKLKTTFEFGTESSEIFMHVGSHITE